MKTRRYIFCNVIVLLSLTSMPAQAQDILTVRTDLGFDFAMSFLQGNIESHGYTVAHVQRCDRGLNKAGLDTDLYRVIFLGKHDEIRELAENRPELAPFLPLKIAIFAEGEHTIISTINPSALNRFFPDESLQRQFRRWEIDLRSILLEVQHSRDERLLETNLGEPRAATGRVNVPTSPRLQEIASLRSQ